MIHGTIQSMSKTREEISWRSNTRTQYCNSLSPSIRNPSPAFNETHRITPASSAATSRKHTCRAPLLPHPAPWPSTNNPWSTRCGTEHDTTRPAEHAERVVRWALEALGADRWSAAVFAFSIRSAGSASRRGNRYISTSIALTARVTQSTMKHRSCNTFDSSVRLRTQSVSAYCILLLYPNSSDGHPPKHKHKGISRRLSMNDDKRKGEPHISK